MDTYVTTDTYIDFVNDEFIPKFKEWFDSYWREMESSEDENLTVECTIIPITWEGKKVTVNLYSDELIVEHLEPILQTLLSMSGEHHDTGLVVEYIYTGSRRGRGLPGAGVLKCTADGRVENYPDLTAYFMSLK
jgi:hypothetical protein